MPVKAAVFTPPFYAGRLIEFSDRTVVDNDTADNVYDSKRMRVSHHGDVYGRNRDRLLKCNIRAAQAMAAMLNKLHGLEPTHQPLPIEKK